MNFTKRSVLAMAAVIVLPFYANVAYADDDHHSSSHGHSHGNGHGLFNGHNPTHVLGLGTNRRHQSSHTNHSGWSTGHGHGGHGGHHGEH